VVVDDLDVVSVAFSPNKANSPPVVYTYAVLTLPIAFQHLEPVATYRSQVPQGSGGIQLPELAPGDALDREELPDRVTLVKSFSLTAAKASDHRPII